MIGVDSSLPGATKSALTQPRPKPQQTPGFGQAPPAISDSAVQDVVNNQLAAGAGTGRAALSSMDRAGVSRGKGQQYRADMAEAAADAQGRAAASKTEMDAAGANAAARNAYDKTMRSEQLQAAGLLEGLRGSAMMEKLAGAGRRQDLHELMRRGQLGLDSMYLDTTPLLDALLR